MCFENKIIFIFLFFIQIIFYKLSIFFLNNKDINIFILIKFYNFFKKNSLIFLFNFYD